MTVEQRLERIERLLILNQKNVLTVDELTIYLNLSESRIRAMCSSKQIPYYKQGRNVYFKKSEIEDWQLARRIPTNDEIRKQAATRYASRKK